MLVHIPDVLTPEQAAQMLQLLDDSNAPWVDGRNTAGYQGAAVKQNRQLDERSDMAKGLGDVIAAALERNPLFISAALPNHLYPPMFNCYANGMHFGSHVDGAVRLVPGHNQKLRTDISATLFLSAPESYDGGELIVQDTYGEQRVKLPSGHMVLYPANSRHQVTPVTRGQRIASFFWVQSLVRDDAQRTLLFDMDTAIQRLNEAGAEREAMVPLVGSYHNLLRMWTDI